MATTSTTPEKPKALQIVFKAVKKVLEIAAGALQVTQNEKKAMGWTDWGN